MMTDQYSLTNIAKPLFTIDVPGFENRVYGDSSKAWLDQPLAIKFCKEYGPGFRMPIGDEVIAFRVAALGTSEESEAKKFYGTGTTVLYVKTDGVLHMAFDDDPNGLVVACAQEGYDLHAQCKRWTLSGRNAAVRAALKRAERTDRIVPAPLETLILSTTLRADKMSEYGQNAVAKAALPKTSELNARIVRTLGLGRGYIYGVTDFNGISENHVVVWRLDAGGNGGIYGLGHDGLNGGGRVRPVRENFQ